MISFFKLYLLLRRNNKLSAKRNVMFEANQYGKLFGYIFLGFMAIYMIGIGTFLGWASAKSHEPAIILLLMPLFLILDFGSRFLAQQTPLMLVKPYLLMSFSRYRAIDCFLIDQLFSSSTLIYLTLFIPYFFINICGGTPFIAAVGMTLLLLMMVVVNSQWYLLVRTLVNQKVYYWILPALFYGCCILPFLLMSDKEIDKSVDHIMDFLCDYGFSWMSVLLWAGLLVLLFSLNRWLQMHFIYDEISKQEKTKLKHVSEFNLLNRFGQMGEYLKLEIKSTMRNKAIRGRFIQGICIIVMLSLLIAYTDIYDSPTMLNIWCLYCFVFFGAVNLIKVMGPEGNYIDLLMVYRENILTLLRAKYYFYSAIVLIPFLLLLPAIISGKFSLMMILAYIFITIGPEYCLLFHMAIWNRQTLPLNEKITGRNQMENKLQIFIELIVFFVPIILVSLLSALFGDVTAYTILTIIGLAFTLAMPIWMKAIYRRMMNHRYANLEGFHSSR